MNNHIKFDTKLVEVVPYDEDWAGPFEKEEGHYKFIGIKMWWKNPLMTLKTS